MSTSIPESLNLAYIGCWFKRDMYSHNCSAVVESLRRCGVPTTVVTSNCRCFSSAQQFDISVDELINSKCDPVKIPHAPNNPGKKHGQFKYFMVRALRLDLWLGAIRGYIYYRKSRNADVIHYDQVLEAFGSIPLFILAALAGLKAKRLFVTVHEIDPFQQRHRWVNRLYSNCEKVIVFSENMKATVAELGIDPATVVVTRYGSVIPDLVERRRDGYIFFGGHKILNNKGFASLIEALRILREKLIAIRLTIYAGHGCGGMQEAREMAARAGVDDMIEWREFFVGEELSVAYQSFKACIAPYTGGSARHTVTTAMANATPVIATRCVDIPEYLGSSGIYIDGSAASIAQAIIDAEADGAKLQAIGMELRQRAIQQLDVKAVAERMRDIYSRS